MHLGFRSSGSLATVAPASLCLEMAHLPVYPGWQREDAPTWDSQKSQLLWPKLGRYCMAGRRGTREHRVQLPCVCTENEIAKIPARKFPRVPDLQRLDLKKNWLVARGLHPCAFKACSTLLPVLPGRRAGRSEMVPASHRAPPHPA